MIITPLAIALMLGTAVGWAGFDAARKSLAAHIEPLPLVFALMLGQVPLFALWTQVVGGWSAAPGYAAPAFASVALNVAANLLFVNALRVSPLSVTIPFLSLSPVFAALAAYPVLGEAPAVGQAFGVVAIVAGAIVVNASGAGGIAGLWRAYLRERGCVYMTVVAALWALSATFDKAACEHADPALHGMVQCAGVGAAVFAWLVVRGRAGEVRGAFGRPAGLLLAVAFGVAALGLQLLAFKVALVSLVEAVKRAVGMLSALVVGRVVFHESVTPSKVAALVLMVVGVALLKLGA